MDTTLRDREFIGQGIAFPFQANARGDVALSIGVVDIEQSIRVILGTMPGERVMRPTFGCRAWELVFDPNHAATHALMTEYVREALTMWEPRIRVERVDSFRDPKRPEALIVEIRYAIKSTHDKRSIVYPFFVDAE